MTVTALHQLKVKGSLLGVYGHCVDKKVYGGRPGTLEDIRVAEDKEGKFKHDKFISRLKEQFTHRWHPGIHRRVIPSSSQKTLLTKEKYLLNGGHLIAASGNIASHAYVP